MEIDIPRIFAGPFPGCVAADLRERATVIERVAASLSVGQEGTTANRTGAVEENVKEYERNNHV